MAFDSTGLAGDTGVSARRSAATRASTSAGTRAAAATVVATGTDPALDGPRPVGVWRRASGVVSSMVGLGAWTVWLAWRVTHAHLSPIGGLALLLEIVAWTCAVIVTVGLRASRAMRRLDRRAGDRGRPVPVVLADVLDIGDVVDESITRVGIGEDDTGEIAWARRGLRVLGARPSVSRRRGTRRALAEAAWAVIALDGLRRGAAVVLTVAVLLTGAVPFDVPSHATVAVLGVAVGATSVGHWLLSGGALRPGARLVWSVASIGAGLGRGVSRSTLPIRWTATMATVVTLNLAVALRGISDRWTHGLSPMDHDPRVLWSCVAMATVGVGLLALRGMTPPELDGYGATRRLEESSVRRLALSCTTAIAVLGLAASLATP